MKILDQYDYHKFLKIKRKYYKRHCIKRIDHFNGKRFVSYWEKDDWIGYCVPSYLSYSLDESMSKEVKLLIGEDLYNDSLDKVKELYDNIWGEYKFSFNYQNEEQSYKGYFISVIITNRDVYFLVSDKQYSKNMNEYVLIPMFWNVEKMN